MIQTPRILRDNQKLREPTIAVALGLAGFLINQLELDLGWGMHFIFGNALVYAFLRVLRPSTLVAAVAISSLYSVLLWNHPWAWAVWTIEAAVVAALVRRLAPVRVDVGFWMITGMPLLLLTYGGILGMDRLSVWLVIAKQAANGVLNITLAEIAYSAFLSLTAARGRVNVPRMPIQALVMTLLMAIILLPMTVYLRLDAPTRAANVRSAAERTLNDVLSHSGETLLMWQSSRGLMLQAFAARQDAAATSTAPALPKTLALDFDRLDGFDARGQRLWTAGASANPIVTDAKRLGQIQRPVEARSRLIEAPIADGGLRMALLVSYSNGNATSHVLASLRPDTLPRLMQTMDHQNLEGLLLFRSDSPTQAVHAIGTIPPEVLRRLSPELRQAAIRQPVLARESGYGTALMNDLKDAMLVRAITIPGYPSWQVLGIASLKREVLTAREGQLQLFGALAAFALLITALGVFLAKRINHSLRSLAQSAADLAIAGAAHDKIDSLVVQELNDISLSITTAGSEVAREHGALMSYRRRLRSIAENAPVVVYALEITKGRKGALLYVSDAAERLLGYTQADVAEPGWWSHAIHPDDYEHCMAALSDLRPGRTVSLEYRLRHQRGHYVWVFDTLAVEADPVLGHHEAVGMMLDISDRKFAAEQLLQADKMASLGRMVAGVAHELNQPLNFIKMAAMNLRERTRRDMFEAPRFAEKLDTMITHVNRASAIIMQMRVFGRKPTEQPHPVALRAAIDAVLTMVTPQLESEGTRLNIADCPADVTVRALPVLLEQVLLNLVLNAHDAIRSRKADGDQSDGLITIRIERMDWQAVLSVEDNGTGLPEESIPLLFEPFFTTKPPREGTGLGLSICYGIVRDLGGAIWAENTGKGARFVIQLPLVDQTGKPEPGGEQQLAEPAA